jgi:hypothetical protein
MGGRWPAGVVQTGHIDDGIDRERVRQGHGELHPGNYFKRE